MTISNTAPIVLIVSCFAFILLTLINLEKDRESFDEISLLQVILGIVALPMFIIAGLPLLIFYPFTKLDKIIVYRKK